MPYLVYSPAIEVKEKDEQTTIDAIIDGMTKQSETVKNRDHHAFRASHAKSTACLTGSLRVLPDLPNELAQGFFANPGTYDVAVRFAQGPGEILNDKVSTHRGMALKIFDVKGETIPEHDCPETNAQDWVFASGSTFPSGTATQFARDGKMLQYATPAPEILKSAVAAVARTAANLTGSALADFYGHPFSHPLSEPYYSQAPMRYGGYVAKMGFFPVSETVEDLKQVQIDTSNDPDAFRTAMVHHFDTKGITFEIRVQLWTNMDKMPIEDASVEWPESESPFKPVAVITIPAQQAHSAERAKYFDDNMSFRPAHTLAAHRPIGGVMRARLQVYDALSKWRHEQNMAPLKEPKSVTEIPA